VEIVGRGQLRLRIGKGVPGVPSDAETKELSQTFCYSNDMEMRQAATQRHFTNQAKHSRKPPKPLEAR
jgi:hypothetical protein